MGFQDVAFLLFRPSFSTTSLVSSGRGECLWTTTFFKAVVGGMHVHAPY